jgi:hypothetical protein
MPVLTPAAAPYAVVAAAIAAAVWGSSPSTPLLSNRHKAAMTTQGNITGLIAVLLHAYFICCCCSAGRLTQHTAAEQPPQSSKRHSCDGATDFRLANKLQKRSQKLQGLHS